ncbi:MAG: TlpA family protein disulfide reductase [Alphaproteobacteria bacterium]|nr:MAG: TlpA family protein disulfide reductase [Alphaproteobacteria bacterium]
MQTKTIRQFCGGIGVTFAALTILTGGCEKAKTEVVMGPPVPASAENPAPEPTSTPVPHSATGVPQLKNPPAAPTIGKVHVIDGTTTSLEKLKGKVVILDFWATWCGPCRMTIPALQEMHEKYAKQGLVVLGISEETPAIVKPFEQRMGMEYTVVADPVAGGTWHPNYDVRSLPTLAVVDRRGKVRLYEVGLDSTPGKGTHDRLNELIPQLIAEK